MSKVVIISAGLHADSNSPSLAEQVAKGAQDAGHEVEIISLSGNETMQEAYELGKNVGKQAEKAPVHSKIMPQNKTEMRVYNLVRVIGPTFSPRRQIIADLGLRQGSRRIFMDNYLKPAVAMGYVAMLMPHCPNAPEQAYRLTDKGRELLKNIAQI